MVTWARVSFFSLILQVWLLIFIAIADEILLSSDKTIAIIDGSGVAADPAGLDRAELVRLAKKRVPIGNFDRSKLSKDGYMVLVEEQDVKLPCQSTLIFNYVYFSNVSHGQLEKSSSMEQTSETRRTCALRQTSSCLVVAGEYFYSI